ncbi:glycosyl hydrolase [Spirochaetia bacterium]|nr:glycosyl hydrolase [Spirochaetia bacterium]
MNVPLSLIIGFHSHVPIGMGDDEFERLYKETLKPLIITLNRYPKIPATLHYSGVLLHWIEKAHPEFFMLIVDLLSRKQVELLGGGFYEPMLPLLPLQDKIGQIEMLTTYIRKQFGKRPQGCWLPAQAWDQNIAGVLNTCGMGYTFLREEQFIQAGLSADAPCITEDQGKLVTVFPIASGITADFKGDGVRAVLEGLARGTGTGGEGRIITVFPEFLSAASGETQDFEGDINRLFEDLSGCESFVEFTNPARCIKFRRQLRRAYFPSSAAGECVPHREGEAATMHPRQFLITYPEVNGIYAKMMFTHVLINQLRGDKSRKRTAQEELWKAQGYDVFCAAGGGGINRNTVRSAVYRALLGAEKITREKGVFIPSLMAFDFDLDGEEEYLFQHENINCYVKSRGASVFEFDFLPRAWNYLDTLGSPGPGQPVEPCRRTSFADILVPPDTPLEALETAGPPVAGVRFCANERYEVLELDKSHEKANFRLPPRQDIPLGSIEIVKAYHLKKDALVVHYTLYNRGAEGVRFRFIPRLDLSFPGEGDLYQRISKIAPRGKEPFPQGEGALQDIMGIEFGDIKNEVLLTLIADRSFDARIFSVRTPCLVHGHETTLYQSTCVMPVKDLSLESDASWTGEFTVKLSH